MVKYVTTTLPQQFNLSHSPHRNQSICHTYLNVIFIAALFVIAKMETSQIAIDRLMDRYIVIYLSFSNEWEQTIPWMNLKHIMLSKRIREAKMST